MYNSLPCCCHHTHRVTYTQTHTLLFHPQRSHSRVQKSPVLSQCLPQSVLSRRFQLENCTVYVLGNESHTCIPESALAQLGLGGGGVAPKTSANKLREKGEGLSLFDPMSGSVERLLRQGRLKTRQE